MLGEVHFLQEYLGFGRTKPDASFRPQLPSDVTEAVGYARFEESGTETPTFGEKLAK